MLERQTDVNVLNLRVSVVEGGEASTVLEGLQSCRETAEAHLAARLGSSADLHVADSSGVDGDVPGSGRTGESRRVAILQALHEVRVACIRSV